MWQDWVLTFTSVLFAVGLVPMLFDYAKPTLWASIPTALGLAIIGGVYLTLGLLFSVVVIWTSTVLWLILAVQRVRKNHTHL